MTTTTFCVPALLLVPTLLTAQRPTLSAAVKPYVAVETPVVALTHVRVIDGTGAAPKEDQTLIIRDGNIAVLGAARSTKVPDGAQVMDLTGKSVIPGLVMMHEHLYYPTGPGVYGADYVSFSRLYLAGGVTSMRTGGNVGGYADLNLAAAIKAGNQVGPWIDATAPYVNGPSQFTQMYGLKDSADARRFVAFWADAGATSFKAYMNITRAELAAATKVPDDLARALSEFERTLEASRTGRLEHAGASADLEAIGAAIGEQVKLLDGVVQYQFGDDAELMGAWASARNVLGPFKPKDQQSGGGGSQTPKAA